MKQLRYFAALAQNGHFGRAAEMCAVSQPALSMQIKELEESLGTPLVERGGRQVRLTPFGQAFAQRAEEILRAVDELGELARAAGAPMAGQLRLGLIPTVAPYLLPAVITGIAARFPDLELLPREAVTSKLTADLMDDRLDAAIVALPLSEPTLSECALFDEEFVLVRPAQDVGKPAPTARALRDMRLLLLEEGHCFREQALSFCHMPPVPRDLIEGTSLTTLVQMVAAGIGVTLIPRMAVAVETRLARVSIAQLPAPRPARTIGMVWRRTSPLAPQFEQVAEIVREAAAAR